MWSLASPLTTRARSCCPSPRQSFGDQLSPGAARVCRAAEGSAPGGRQTLTVGRRGRGGGVARRRVAVVELGEEEAAYLPTTTTTDPAASFSDSRARLWRNRLHLPLHPSRPSTLKHAVCTFFGHFALRGMPSHWGISEQCRGEGGTAKHAAKRKDMRLGHFVPVLAIQC